jgi:hypothetical protein
VQCLTRLTNELEFDVFSCCFGKGATGWR